MKELKFCNKTWTTNILLLPLSRKLTTTTTWQLRVYGLLLSLIYSNHKFSHLCFSLSYWNSNWRDQKVLDINLDLDNPKYVWRQTPLDLTRDSYTQHINNHKNVARVFPFILKAKYKTLHVKRVWAELEKSAEKQSARASIDRA